MIRLIVRNRLADGAVQDVLPAIKTFVQYYDNPEAATEEHPVVVEEIDDLIRVITEIMEYQLDGDLTMEVYAGGSIDAVLDYVRAFQRIRQDFDPKEDGFSLREYRGDDYNALVLL